MKALVIAATLVMLGISSASAAEMTSYSWRGFYIGANAGVAFSRNEPSLVIGPNDFFNDSNIPVVQTGLAATGRRRTDSSGGGQIGFNWQLSPNWLFGLEADVGNLGSLIGGTDARDYPTNPGIAFTQSSSTRIDWAATFRPRIGWTSDNWMVFGTGGLAVANVQTSFTFADPHFDEFVNSTSRTTRAGWVAGGGIEWAPWRNNWTVKAEGSYYDFGRISQTGNQFSSGGIPSFTGFNYANHVTAAVARVGLNYKFGGAVVAR